MIWKSDLLMTVFDALIVIVTLASMWVLYSSRGRFGTARSIRDSSTVVLGLIVIGLLYLADLVIMWILPLFVSEGVVAQAMLDLHLNYSWFLLLLGVAFFFVGFLRLNRGLIARTDALREKKEQLHMALEGARVGTWSWTIKTEAVTWSDHVEGIFGLAPGAFDGTLASYMALVYPDDVDAVKGAIRHALDTETDYEVEHRIIWPDDSVRWLQGKGRVYRDNQGQPDRMAGTVTDITERKQAEEALKESEERFQTLLREVNDVVWTATGDGSKMLYVNEACETVYGFPSTDLIENPNRWMEVIHPDDLARVQQELVDFFTQGRIEQQYRIVRPDSEVRWLYDRKHLIFDEAGTAIRMGGLLTDVTGQIQAEQALKKSQQHLLTAQRIAQLGSWSWNVQTNVSELSEETLRIFGHDSSEPMDFGEFLHNIHPEDQEQTKAATEAALSDGKPFEMHYRVVRPDSSVRHIISRGEVEVDETGGPLKLVGTMHDVTETRQAQETSRRSEARHRAMVDAVPDMMFRYRIDGTFLDFKAQEDQLMMPAEELIGSSIVDSPLPMGVVEDIMRLSDKALETGERQILEYALPLPGGQKVFEARIVTSGVDEVIALVRDITERVQVQEEREAFVEELELRNAELERFTYTVSHDLKSPLVTIKNFLGVLKQDIAQGDTERIEHDFTFISSAADKMHRLLHDLLDLSRTGHRSNPFERVSLTAVAHEAVDLVAGQIAERGVEVEIDPAMPVVWGDRVRLLEVYQNLVENAVKFMGEQPKPRVEIGTRRTGAEYECYVRDNGMGVAPKYHEKIFGLFERLDPHIDGTGIGLALVRRIVEMHSGRIWVESEGEGCGSTFRFTLRSKSLEGQEVKLLSQKPIASSKERISTLRGGQETETLYE